jgi:hypothetical protein
MDCACEENSSLRLLRENFPRYRERRPPFAAPLVSLAVQLSITLLDDVRGPIGDAGTCCAVQRGLAKRLCRAGAKLIAREFCTGLLQRITHWSHTLRCPVEKS